MFPSAHAPPDAAASARRDRLVALAVAVLGLVTRLPFVDADEGWFDELFSIYVAGQSVPELLQRALEEQTNPPGYYLLAHAWGLIGGNGVGWHRMLPALSGAFVGALLVLAARRLGLSRATAALAGVLATAAPFLWQMSLEIRAYAPLALVTAAALWVAAGIVRDETPGRMAVRALAAMHVAMVLLHYFGALAVAGIVLGTVAARRVRADLPRRESLRLALRLGAPAALTVAAWFTLAALWPQGLGGRNVAWIPETGALDALRGVPGLVLGSLGRYGHLLSLALLLGGVAIAGRRALAQPDASRGEDAAAGRFLLFAAVLPILLALGLHLAAGRTLWVPRYLSGFIPGLALVAALVAEALPRRLRAGAALGFALWWLTAGSLSFANRWPKPDWTRILAILGPEGRATICADGSFVGLPFLFHARAQGLTDVRVVNPGVCRPTDAPTWLVYDVERTGVVAPPQVPGLVLGPRIVLFRGVQNLDARRVIRRD